MFVLSNDFLYRYLLAYKGYTTYAYQTNEMLIELEYTESIQQCIAI